MLRRWVRAPRTKNPKRGDSREERNQMTPTLSPTVHSTVTRVSRRFAAASPPFSPLTIVVKIHEARVDRNPNRVHPLNPTLKRAPPRPIPPLPRCGEECGRGRVSRTHPGNHAPFKTITTSANGEASPLASPLRPFGVRLVVRIVKREACS